MELTKQEKIAAANSCLKDIAHAIYLMVIRKRVFDRVEDKAASENCIKELEKLERMNDEYSKILAEIEQGQ
jgi:hypothetical protein